MEWPDWWSWDVEFTLYLLKPMVDRRFNEVDLRLKLADAAHFYENHEEGRMVVETTHDGRRWAVVVEPLPSEKVLIIVMAYPMD